MAPLVSSLLLALGLVLALATAVADTDFSLGYPVLVTGAAFFCALLVIAKHVRNLRASRSQALPFLDLHPATAVGKRAMLVVAFGAIWIAYVLLLPFVGFIVASSGALILSLWIANGEFSWRASLGAALFILVLAILVSTVLFVPVPKSRVDYVLDEFIFSVLGG